MTEDEARKKWCPMVRFLSNEPEERYPEGHIACTAGRCIASDCMMWVEHGKATAEFNADIVGDCGLKK